MKKFNQYINENYDLNDHLVSACINFDLPLMKQLIGQGANIHTENDLCLRHICFCGNLDIVRFLIENGADIHSIHDAPLKLAFNHGHLDIVKYLVPKYDPQYIIDEYPEFIKYLDLKYSHIALTGKFGVFDDEEI